ncbi:hypothetical protein DY023_03965 [Microbacterium bovistercoris]|uniref:ATP-grasp domain-containing protein n=1 Tax=Microbacterium bovistercoris TaxID=2293570 RepID=A0A371NWF1_9MICO|nr:hypothetical protein DY023_03965 [Microbacterium bovistercoris]
MPHIGILTQVGDLHAELVAYWIKQAGGRVSLIYADRVPTDGGISFDPAHPESARLRADDGVIAIGDLDLMWWRRVGKPRVPERVRDAAAREVVSNESRDAVVGLVRSGFRGIWVSDPDATRSAEFKLVQLCAAVKVGLRVPATLVSQVPDEIRNFCERVGGRMVTKPVASPIDVPLRAGVVTSEGLPGDDVLALSPAIYQELVPGEDHLRACTWGSTVICGTVKSPMMDWRTDSNPTIGTAEIDADTAARLAALNVELGLEMGISDLKPAADGGVPYWLEVNPQGQFLFLEGLGGPEVAKPFAEFLLARAATGTPPAGGRRPASRSGCG